METFLLNLLVFDQRTAGGRIIQQKAREQEKRERTAQYKNITEENGEAAHSHHRALDCLLQTLSARAPMKEDLSPGLSFLSQRS